jgi:hypothetical protein
VLYPERLTPAVRLPGGVRRYRWGATSHWLVPEGSAGMPEVRTAIAGVGCIRVWVYDCEEQRRLAEHFGYGYGYGNWYALNFSSAHDLLHTALAVAEGLPCSETLRLVALSRQGEPEALRPVHEEEVRVWAFCRLTQVGEWHPSLLGPVLGADRAATEALAARVRRLLRGGD